MTLTPRKVLQNVTSEKNRILLRELVATDFKLRYQGSVIGYAWALIKPLFIFGIIYVVFVYVLKIGKGIDNYGAYLLLGIILWSFFTEATNQGKSVIVDRGSLIRKISFPKYVVVVSATVSALTNLMINMIVVFIFMIVSGIKITPLVLLLPLLIIELYIFTLAVSFILSAVFVKFRDVGHIWEVFLQAAFYATPIIWPLNIIHDKHETLAAVLVALNPVAQVIQDSRYVLINQHQTLTLSGMVGFKSVLVYLPVMITLASVVVASIYFRNKSKRFAENI